MRNKYKFEFLISIIWCMASICTMVIAIIIYTIDKGRLIYIIGALLSIVLALLRLFLSRQFKSKLNLNIIRVIDLAMIVIVYYLYNSDGLFWYLTFLIVISSFLNTCDSKKTIKISTIYLVIYSLSVIGKDIINGFKPLIELNKYSNILVAIVLNTILVVIIKLFAEQKKCMQTIDNSNVRLNKKLSEFYTLQRLQSIIHSYHDTQELLEAVNDIIIGLFGPSSSGIMLNMNKANKKDNSLFIINSNDKDIRKEEWFKSCCINIYEKISDKGIILNENNSDNCLFDDSLITCFIAVPLIIKNRKVGMIIVAHNVSTALNEEHLSFMELVASNISIALENTHLYEEMRNIAIHDGLTMTYNRMYFNQRLEEEFLNSYNNRNMSVAICDADDFKKINDNYGHIFGDRVLKEVSRIISVNIRNGDILSRYGGEEFVIIFPRTDIIKAYNIVERVRKIIADTKIEDMYHSTNVTVSFGVASYPEHGDTARRILTAADKALYNAKSNGRNCTFKAV